MIESKRKEIIGGIMIVIKRDDEIVINNLEDFSPKKIFECGQAFRYTVEEDGSYTVVALGKAINVSRIRDEVVLKGTNLLDYENIWKHYFDLDRDYEEIRAELSKDEVLRPALEYGKGIRILNQDIFETAITFIISANNQIPRIKKAVDIIARLYGDEFKGWDGKSYYSFPTAEVLKEVSPAELREKARVGFRDERIVRASEMIYNKEVDIDAIKTMELSKMREELMKLPGVGPKVADCILLFSFGKSESFPVDVWIKRVVEELYIKEEINKNKVADYGRKIFGDYAGFAQQYLFYYGRENKLGK